MLRIVPKKKNFSDEQNAALREALRRYVDQHHITNQTEIGDLLGVTQQTASSFLAGKSDLSFGSARRIALLVGADGVEDFLDGLGLLPDRLKAPEEADPYPNRAFAVRLARRINLSSSAITAVRSMMGAGLESRKQAWWMTQIVAFDEEHKQAAREVAAAKKKHERETRRRRRRPDAA